ncbi:unnamed protein product [Symbiodinium natans]|uniref:Glycosyltransferase 61 catalytic domain-containing protein n=1 Tax=Symbiodinium natans TaxID=878477 RepID=A0A812TKZ6_9DINO|nr:unnamed protein product [Symbiodinium natans]
MRILACLVVFSLRGASAFDKLGKPDDEPCSFAETAAGAVLIPSAHALQQCNHKVWSGYYQRTLDMAARPPIKIWELRTLQSGHFIFPSHPLGPRNMMWQIHLWTKNVTTSSLNKHFFSEFPTTSQPINCGLTISKPVTLYRAFAPRYFQYGHVITDLLPMVFWIYTTMDTSTIAVETDSKGKIPQFLQWFDSKLHERIVYVPADTIVCTESKVTVLNPKSWVVRPELLRLSALVAHVRQHVTQKVASGTVDRVIAYERLEGTTTTGRLLDKSQFRRLVDLAKDALRAAQRPPDSIVLYNGKDGDKPMSFEQQYRLFSSAYLVFGPHGAGMGNVLWMQSADCTARPAVIEFICSTDTRSVTGCYVTNGLKKLNRIMSFWRLLAGAPWVRYFHVWMLHHDDHESNVASVDEVGFNISLYAALRGAGPQMRRLRGLRV